MICIYPKGIQHFLSDHLKSKSLYIYHLSNKINIFIKFSTKAMKNKYRMPSHIVLTININANYLMHKIGFITLKILQFTSWIMKRLNTCNFAVNVNVYSDKMYACKS